MGGNHEHQAIGHGYEPALYDDVGPAIAVVRPNQLIAKSNLLTKVSRPGFLGEKRIGARFDQTIIDEIRF